MNGYTGSLPSGISPGIQPDTLCSGGGKPDNIIWFSFIPTSFSFSISISYNNCTTSPNGQGIQAGIYADQNFQNEVDCNVFPNPALPVSLSGSGVTPGEILYLFIDGADGVICDFQINVISGISTIPLTFEWVDGDDKITSLEGTTQVQDFQNVCLQQDSLTRYIAPECLARSGSLPIDDLDQFNLYCYEWTISPPGGGTIVGDPNAREIEIDWEIEGDYNVHLELIPNPDLLNCSNSVCSDVQDMMVSVRNVTENILDTIFICPGQPVEFCGEMIEDNVTRECITNFGSCEKNIQPFKIYELDTIDYGTQVTCGSDCFELFGFQYCTNGEYVILDPFDCFRRHAFTIEGFFIDIDLPTSMELDCDADELIISPIINTNYDGNITYRWEENGNLYQSDSILSINRTGEFDFIVEFPDLTGTCGGIATIQILENNNAPDFDIIIPTIDCDSPVDFLSFVEIDPIDSISWEGANGFQSNNNQLVLNAGGTFSLFIRGENGCIADSTFTVEEDTETAIINLTYDNLDCVLETSLAEFESNLEVQSSLWALPDNSTVNAENLSITTPGNYQLTVTAINGCSTVVPFTVIENVDYPIIEAGEDQTWQCNTESLNINGQVEAGSFDIQWDFVELGLILTDPNVEIIEVGSPGRYILNVRNLDNGCVSRDSVNISLNDDIPELMETMVTNLSCFAESDGVIEILSVSGGEMPYNFFIDGAPTEGNNEIIENLEAGTYILTVIDDFGCELQTEIQVSEPEEIGLEVPPDVEIGFNESYVFQAIHDLEEDELAGIFWYDENGNLIGTGPTLNFIGGMQTTISVEVVNINGCSTVREISIGLDADLPIFAPNVFSPNADGINDMFTIFARDYPGIVLNLSIFDRWGELMYSVDDLEFDDESRGWNGLKGSQPVQQGVYTYKASIRLVDESIKLVAGDITLIR
jgi:gliding motility-associated-like protein